MRCRARGSIDLELPVGARLLRAEAEGYKTWVQGVEGQADEFLPLVLEPLPRPPAADAVAARPLETRSRTGGFAELSAVGLFAAAGDPVFDCGRAEVASCGGNGGPFGGGVDTHFGYQVEGRNGALGVDIELMLLSMAAGMKRDVTLRTRTDSLNFVSPFAVVGVGPRYTTRGRRFRGTAAVDLAAAVRGYVDSSSEAESVGNFRLVPATSISVGGVLGEQSGAQLTFGIRSFVEFPHSSELGRTAKGAPVAFGSTTTLTVGPYFGVMFGP